MITLENIKELITDDMLKEIAHRYNEAMYLPTLDSDIGDIIIFALDQHIEKLYETDSYEVDSACIDADNANFINEEL